MTAFRNPGTEQIRDLLGRVRTIAVVGLSPHPDRPSHRVAAALQRFGYRVIPVRPAIERVLGETAYGDLREVPDRVDLVDVFRAPEYLPAIVEAAIEIGAPAIWFQEGVVNEVAAERARSAGLFVVMDRCVYRDYLALFAAEDGSSAPSR